MMLLQGYLSLMRSMVNLICPKPKGRALDMRTVLHVTIYTIRSQISHFQICTFGHILLSFMWGPYALCKYVNSYIVKSVIGYFWVMIVTKMLYLYPTVQKANSIDVFVETIQYWKHHSICYHIIFWHLQLVLYLLY